MDRVTVQYGQVPLETDLLQAEQNVMVGLAKLAEAALGTGPVVDGFAVSPTAPASMSVVIGTGQIYEQENVEATAWSSLPVNTTTVVKQGLLLAAAAATIAAPATVGYSQCYLVEVSYQDVDTGLVVRPYYNAANPAVNFNGPGNAGTKDSTVRQGAVSIQLKAGIAAATGTQTIPSPDAGYVGVAVVTVSYGQTTVTAGNITSYPGAPFLAVKLGNLPAYMQQDSPVFCIDQGTASNSLVVAPTPAFGAYVAGQRLAVQVAYPITGAATINVSGLGSRALVRQGGAACIGGEAAVGDILELRVRASDVQIVRLTTSDMRVVATTAVTTSTTINTTTLAYINAATPVGETHLFANASGLVNSDIAVTPSNTTMLTSGNFTGASFIEGSVSCAMRNTDTSGFFLGFACQVMLNDVTSGTNAVQQSSYLGASATSTSTTQIQIPFGLAFKFQGLTAGHVYNLSIVARKAAAYGPVQTYDGTINGYHNGTNQ